ncbi:hypothetical protein [Adhaeribacter radiodurans]|uniref:Uncharacterized protein n=1 Tax=Adhaeribacter radiodurans TaxID=2745197 RepID=A0A7L7LBR8_9BACT|nr:hypothetical protein [Adhaeribacter radiodurans]QMU30144.1 hypothetical protein HUW48_19860 [Adhaeribacter radiodurans]
MKKDWLMIFWMAFLGCLIIGYLTWAVFFVDKPETKVSVFGITAAISAAVTSVLAVNINHKKTKEREFEFLILKEKQKVYSHFYNALFDSFHNSRVGQEDFSQETLNELMNFKKGLINWGSERLIKKYLTYDNIIAGNTNVLEIITASDEFLREIRKDLGHEEAKNINLVGVVLNPEARKELYNLQSNS